MAESKDPQAPPLAPATASAGSARERARRARRRWAMLPIRYEAQQSAALPSGRIWFVLETDRLLDRLILEDLCVRNAWPEPDAARAGLWSVRTIKGFLWRRRLAPRDVAELEAVIARDHALGGSEDVALVPVAIFWGRAPQRENSLLEVLASEDWGLAGRLRRFVAVLVHGRNVLVKVGDPIRVASLLEGDAEQGSAQRNDELVARKAGRLLRVFFQEQRAVTIGPDLSHRRLLLEEVLESPAVVAAIRRDVRSSAKLERRVRAKARRYAAEIAADYSHPVVRLLERGFTWLWNRWYEGIDVRHLERLTEVAPGSEIVYVPCHRSHIDYMLLGYVIYRNGLALPHIAAGINLNLPIVGSILRRGGAFFIRRTFHGNALYTAVFRSYFRMILARGFPIKYFIEGGRSRTGRLLQPKVGLITMTVQSYLADRDRPVVFVPVYLGYEKIVEGQTFIGELSGERKKKETLGGVLRSLKTLRERFGRVHVSFGEPIRLDDVLDVEQPGWREEELDEQFRPEWLGRVAQRLGLDIMTAINEAAVINAVNLTALVVLCMPKQAIVEVELRAQLALYIELARRAPYAARAGQPDLDAAAMIERCERMRWLTRRAHALGDILYMDERTAVLSSYYRNNVLHLFALPSLIATAFINRLEITTARLHSLVEELYPCLRGELYLCLTHADLGDAIDRTIAAMLQTGMLETRAGLLLRPPESSARAGQLRLCAEIVQPFLERYYLCITMLLNEGSGALTSRELVRRCAAASEQLALVHSSSSPDLFQGALFDTWIAFLERIGVLAEDAASKLLFDEPLLAELAGALGFVLPPRLRQTLVNLAGVANLSPSLDADVQPAESDRAVRRSGPESERSRAE
jgi:glycerol-3-phosphate O-acyltransferase